MHTNPTHNDDGPAILERYLDGLLSESERTEFEARITNDPELRSQVERQEGLRARLAGMYEPQSVRHVAGVIGATRASRQPSRYRRLGWLVGVAAVLAVVVAVRWAQNPEGDASRERLFKEYNRQVAAGFKPAEVCTTDQEFVKWTNERFKSPLRPVHPAEGTAPVVTLVGWDHTPMFSYYTGLLLARVEGTPVLVVMDPKVAVEAMPSEKHRGPQRMFARQVGGVWMFEITTLDRATVIPLIEAAK